MSGFVGECVVANAVPLSPPTAPPPILAIDAAGCCCSSCLQDKLIAKQFMFKFVNSYAALAFIAFAKEDPVPDWLDEIDTVSLLPSSSLLL